MKTLAKIIAGLLAIAILAGILTIITTMQSVPPNRTQPAATVTPRTARTPPQLTIGDTATIDGWEVTLNSAEWVTEVGRDILGAYVPEEGSMFLYVSITVTNLNNRPRRFIEAWGIGDGIRTDIVYADEFTFTQRILMTYDKALTGQSINPLSDATGSIVYSIANRAADSSGKLVLRFFVGRETVEFVVR
jgi:hypothetical protein